MDTEIRPATTTDVAGILHVAYRAWHSAHGPIIGSDTVDRFLNEYYTTEVVRSRVEDDSSILDVAVDAESDVVGFVLASPADSSSTTFTLSWIYVHPDRWREGIGQRLLDHTEQKVERRGGERIKLGVMAENERAVNFYESTGYGRGDEFYDDRIDARGFDYVKHL